MFFKLIGQWIATPTTNRRLLHNFTRQDFSAQFSASVGGFLWLFLTPVVHIIVYSFVFAYIFQVRTMNEFAETSFVNFMIVGYLPWFAFAEALSKSPGLLLEKAPLITKVKFPVQIIPLVGTLVPYVTHSIGIIILLAYLALQGYLSWMWLALPVVFFLQFLFALGIVCLLSALCVFLRDLQQLVGLIVMIWFFLTPIIYQVSMIGDEAIQNLFLLNPMHSFISMYREITLLGTFPWEHFQIAFTVSVLSYLLGGWLFMKIRPAFGDVL